MWGHFALLSFLNRASSHKGIVSAVHDENAHAAFTLLRAYLELVVLVRYVDTDPEFINELEKERREGKRKRFRDLFEAAAEEFGGVLRVYDDLNEIAHFGATAFWHPFYVEGEDDLTMSLSTGPHWRRPDDPKIALAMLEECDEMALAMLERFFDHHVAPGVQAIIAWRSVLGT